MLVIRTPEAFFKHVRPGQRIWRLLWDPGGIPDDVACVIYEKLTLERLHLPWSVDIRSANVDKSRSVPLSSLIGDGSDAAGNEGVCLTEADALAYLRDRQEACFNDPRTRAVPQWETPAPEPALLENA